MRKKPLFTLSIKKQTNKQKTWSSHLLWKKMHKIAKKKKNCTKTNEKNCRLRRKNKIVTEKKKKKKLFPDLNFRAPLKSNGASLKYGQISQWSDLKHCIWITSNENGTLTSKTQVSLHKITPKMYFICLKNFRQPFLTGLDYLSKLLSTKEPILGNDPSNHPCKHLFRFKPAIVLSGIVTEMDIQQLALFGMLRTQRIKLFGFNILSNRIQWSFWIENSSFLAFQYSHHLEVINIFHAHDFKKPFALISFNYTRSLATHILKRCFLRTQKYAYSTVCRNREESCM